MGNIHSVLLIPNDDHADLVREGVCNSRPPTMTFGSQGFDAGYHWSCDWDGGGIRVPVNTPDTALVLAYECKPTGALSDLHSQFGEETDDDLFDRLRETWGSKCGFALKFLALSLEGYGRVIAIDAEGAEMVFAPDDRCSNCGHPRSDHHPGGLKMNDEYNPHEYGSILYCYQSSRMRGTGVTCGCMSFVEAPCET
jgi:hypothetical protein